MIFYFGNSLLPIIVILIFFALCYYVIRYIDFNSFIVLSFKVALLLIILVDHIIVMSSLVSTANWPTDQEPLEQYLNNCKIYIRFITQF